MGRYRSLLSNQKCNAIRLLSAVVLAVTLCSCQSVPSGPTKTENTLPSPRETTKQPVKEIVRLQNKDDVGHAARVTKAVSELISDTKGISGHASRVTHHGHPNFPPHTVYAQLPPGASYQPIFDQDAPWKPPGIRGPWPQDEFLFDGGDQNVPAEVGADLTVGGLEVEDTIGHFDTVDGETGVVPTNRVPIYAPRFAAVRKVYGLSMNEGYQHAARTQREERILLHEDLSVASTALQRIQPRGRHGMKQPSIFRERTRSAGTENRWRLAAFRNAYLPHEDFQIVRHGDFENSEKARLSQAIDAAITWSSDQAVQVVVDGKKAAVHHDIARAQETSLYERPKGKPRLRVFKLASTGDAQPGDVIDFTIRFDNIGTKRLDNVTIIDNLTTRLEYVPDSAQCSLKADFFTQENEAESLVLRWDLINPLEREEGGVIRFQCRVR